MMSCFPWDPPSNWARFVNEIFPDVGPTFFGTAYFFQSDSEGNVVVGSDLHAMDCTLGVPERGHYL